MGVSDLWEVLSPVARTVQLKELRSKRLAVDLSGWIVESERTSARQHMHNPVIRNLFYRCNKLLQCGIKLIFVLDGEAPEVKEETLSQRSQIRFGEGTKPAGAPSGGRSRRGLQALTSQCQDLLDALGLPYVQSAGEAEGTCAYLDKKMMVDGCITQDGDAFLYGARTVYRKLCIEDKDAHVLEYKMSDIEETLGLDREKLVAFAVLAGCDYCKGVPNVGKETVLKLLKKFGDDNCLQRLRAWSLDPEYNQLQETVDHGHKKPTHCGNCQHPGTRKSHGARGCEECGTEVACTKMAVSNCSCDWHRAAELQSEWKMELKIRRKALKMHEEFPPRDVISEFLDDRDDIPSVNISWQLPSVNKFESFMSAKLNWSREKSQENLFPLLTRWHLECGTGTCKELETLKPVRIVKERVRRDAYFYEVEWLASGLWTESSPPNTLEPQELFEGVYPDLVKSFHDEQLNQKRSKKKVVASDDGRNGDIREHFKVLASAKQRQPIKDEGKRENVEKPAKERTATAPEKVRPISKSHTVVTRTRKPKKAPPLETMVTLHRYCKQLPRSAPKSPESLADSSLESFNVPLSQRIARTASEGTSSTESRSLARKNDLESARNLPRCTDFVESDSDPDEASLILVHEAPASGGKKPEGKPTSRISMSMSTETEAPLSSTEVFKADALDEASLILLQEASAIGGKQPGNKPASRTSTNSPEPIKIAASLSSDLPEEALASSARRNRASDHSKGFTNTAAPRVLPYSGTELAASGQSDIGGKACGDSTGCAASADSRKPSWPTNFNLSLSDSLMEELMTSKQVSGGQVGEDSVCGDGSREPDVGCTPPKRRSVSPGSSSKRTPGRLGGGDATGTMQSPTDSAKTSSRRSCSRRRLSFEPATSTPVAASAMGLRNVEIKVEQLTGEVVASVEMRVATPGSSRSDSCDQSRSLFCFEKESQESLEKGGMSVIVISDNDDDC